MGRHDEYIVNNDVDLIQASNELEKILSVECNDYQLLGEKSNKSASWFFSLKGDEILGFIYLEANEDTIAEPTITIAVKICNAADLSRDALFDILSANGDLWRAAYTVARVQDDMEFLLIQYKTLLSSFKKDDFVMCINHLVDQYETTLGAAINDESSEIEEENK